MSTYVKMAHVDLIEIECDCGHSYIYWEYENGSQEDNCPQCGKENSVDYWVDECIGLDGECG